MRNVFFFAFVLSGCGVPGFESSDVYGARKASLSGVVTDALSGVRIANAGIYRLSSYERLGSTDDTGVFFISQIRPGSADFQVRADEYIPQELSILLHAGSNVIPDVPLNPSPCTIAGNACHGDQFCDANAHCMSKAGGAVLNGEVIDDCWANPISASYQVNSGPFVATQDNGQFRIANLDVAGEAKILISKPPIYTDATFNISLPGPVNPPMGFKLFSLPRAGGCDPLDCDGACKCPDGWHFDGYRCVQNSNSNPERKHEDSGEGPGHFGKRLQTPLGGPVKDHRWARSLMVQ